MDWAVHMKRLPDEARADVLAQARNLRVPEVDRLASHLAAFHAAARCDDETSRYGSVDSIQENIDENFDQTRDIITGYVTAEQAREIEQWQRQFLKKAELFGARVKAHRIRDGHGDLRLEHVYFRKDGSITILDCIEFNDRFRYADVCSDIAFLSMDLAWRNQVDLAERLLAQYAAESNDFDLYSVDDFYESYRAFVRGKIASFVASDPLLPPEVRQKAEREARRYFLLALACERPPLVPPSVVAVGGVIASGKTTLADAIAQELSAPVVGSDRTRKHLLGFEATDSAASGAWAGAYDPEFSQQVYDEVLRRAGVVLDSNRAVIIDASFRSRAMRAAARELATRHGVPFLMVECKPDVEMCRRRLREREQESGQISDARVGLLDEFVRQFEPIEELPAEQHVMIDTARPLIETLEELRRVLPESRHTSG